MADQGNPVLDVLVVNRANEVVADATVRLRPEVAGIGAEQGIELSYDEGNGRYRTEGITPGCYVLSAEHPQLAGDERGVVVSPAGGSETFMLGESGLPYFRRGPVKVPFQPRTDIVGVTFRPAMSTDEAATAASALSDMGLAELPVSEDIQTQNTRVLQLTQDAADLETVVTQLSERPDIERAGPVVSFDGSSVQYLTDELSVCFADSVSEGEAHQILTDAGFEVLRRIPYGGNVYHVRQPAPASYALLDLAAQLDGRPDVLWAEPNLAGAFELDGISPTDFLWNGLWDRGLVGLPDAWRALQNMGGNAFGSPNVIIADVDQGIASSGGVPTHPDFQGAVSSGAAKVYRLFDFRTLVANNDSPMGNHGMGTAGVATARANNASVVVGTSEGLTGAAPNCPVMGLIFPSTEVDIADMYIWAAGFDPNSPRAGFPGPISPGADVFTTSIGFGAGFPLSAVAKAMLDYITTYGRGGKGCLAFFSAGNGNMNVATVRPYASYERSFGTAATSLDDDGVTEIRAPYSGWGTVELCAPSHDEFVGGGSRHNPPQNFAPWSCDLPGQGNLPGHVTHTTTLAAAAAAGATSLQVASTAGINVGDALLLDNVGVVGGETARVTGVPSPSTGQVPCTALLNTHAAGTIVRRGPANYRNNFGGTSSATPLAAGCAALVLSAEPDLTWAEARETMRDTSVKFDLGNTDPNGRWIDRNGNPITTSGQPAYFSQWYGHGRMNAAGAVQDAVTYDFARDLMIRDNLADLGSTPTAGAFWNSPDIWVRNASPGSEGAAALPASYGSAGPHQPPIAGQDNWVYVRVRNRGTQPSYDAYVRMYLTHWPGLEFTYPNSFIPTNRPAQSVPSPLTPGTYLIGEQKISDLAAGADIILNVQWPAAMVPPQEVTVAGMKVKWHPCLLVEVSPHDGPPPSGNHVWDRNNLAQKNLTIIYANAGQTFASALVLGNLFTTSRLTYLEIDRGALPGSVKLHVDLVDPKLIKWLKEYIRLVRPPRPIGPGVPVPGMPVRPGSGPPMRVGPSEVAASEGMETVMMAATMPAQVAVAEDIGALGLGGPGGFAGLPSPVFGSPVIALPQPPVIPPGRWNFRFGHVGGREVLLVGRRGRTIIPVGPIQGPTGPIIVGGVVGGHVPEKSYEITVIQRDELGRTSGAAAIELHPQ